MTVTDLLIDFDPEREPFAIHLTSTETGETIVNITSDEIINKLLTKYGEWRFVYNASESPNNTYNYTTPQIPLQEFENQWYNYVDFNKDNWERMLEAYDSKYNPIENYDRIEEKAYTDTITRDGSVINTNDQYNYTSSSGTNTHAYNKLADITVSTPQPSRGDDGTITVGKEDETNVTTEGQTTSGITNTTSHSTYDDSTQYVGGTKNETQGIEQDIPTATGYSKSLNDNTTKYDQYKETTTHRDGIYNEKGELDTPFRIHGNIGVTTAPQMITEELNLRKLDMLEYIVTEFAKKYLAYFPFDEDEDNCYGFVLW